MRKIMFFILVMFISCQGFSQTNLMNKKSWAYWLQNIDIQTIVKDASFELIVMDYSADGLDSDKWTQQQIDSIKNSGKIPVSYISIGEAEDYRYYWNSEWSSDPPSWLGPENPDWDGNYKVRFWEEEWESIIFNYLDTIIMQGFDGIYMDIIDAYYFWSEEEGSQTYADSLMCQFIIDIREYCDSKRGNNTFILLPQNGEDVWDQENVSSSLKNDFFNAINGIGVEDVFFIGPGDEDNPFEPDEYRIGILQEYLLNEKQVFSVEYLTQTDKISQFREAAANQNFIPYVCTRSLDHLCEGITSGIPHISADFKDDIVIYPNPATRYLKLSFDESEFNKDLTLSIHNLVGQLIDQMDPPEYMGNVITLDISDYQAGYYIILISDGEASKSVKLLIIKN